MTKHSVNIEYKKAEHPFSVNCIVEGIIIANLEHLADGWAISFMGERAGRGFFFDEAQEIVACMLDEWLKKSLNKEKNYGTIS